MEMDAQFRSWTNAKYKGMDINGEFESTRVGTSCLMFYRSFKIQERTEVGHRRKKLPYIF